MQPSIRNIYLLALTLFLAFSHIAKAAGPQTVAAAATTHTPPRLSPATDNDERYRLSLDGPWRFTTKAPSGFCGLEDTGSWATIQVPGEWVMQGFEVTPGDAAGYVRHVDIPDSWKGRRIKLRFNAVYSGAKLLINGHPAGSHSGGFTPFETDITDHINFGRSNTIALEVTGATLADSVASGSAYAVHQLGGITRSATITALPEVNIAMLHTSTSFTDSSCTDARLHVEVAIANETHSPVDKLSLHFTLHDSLGNTVELTDPTITIDGVARNDTRNIDAFFDIKAPKQWTPEHPYLYTLTCRLSQNGRQLTAASRRVGFREVKVDGNRLLVNGVPVKLRGVCRHETRPDRGRSLSAGDWRRDVDLFRKGNVNYIRTSHYPPDEALLDAADELGMFVEAEAPFCWSHQTKVDSSRHAEIYVNQHLEMINAFRSHPSVIIWSLGNESVNFADYKEAAEAIKQIDPTRPRNFSQWGPDADEGTLEITNHHYPGPRGPEIYRNYPRPVVFDEYCHLNAYNRLELSADPGLRDMWGEMLDSMWTNMVHSRGVAGGAIWVGIDDTFFLPDGRTVGYGTWGTIDGWRREKPEYWGMKKAYSPVKISLQGTPLADGRTIRLNADNRHLFTNLNECVIHWQAGNATGEVRPDIAPRSEGTIKITLPAEALSAPEICLSVTGSRGFEIDRYRFALNDATAGTCHGKPKRKKISLKSTAPDYITVKSGKHTFNIDRSTGSISAINKDRKLLTSGPELMILPLNGDGEGIQMTGKSQTFTPYNPVCSDWTVSNVDAKQTRDGITVTVDGRYNEAEGVFTYRFTTDGALTVDYDFTLLDSISPRQTGIVFTSPSDFNNVAWTRDSYWGTYPDDHIGAVSGKAVALTDSLPIVGIAGPSDRPTWSWSLDQTANGSNIFRSTKRNIRNARLSVNEGPEAIDIESDGSQHFRPWIDGASTRFLVADYTNGGHDTYLISHAEKAYRPLVPGDKVKGSVRLTFE